MPLPLLPLHTAPGAAQRDVDGRCCIPEAALAEASGACLLAEAVVGSAGVGSAGVKAWKASELGVDARRAPANAERMALVCTRRGRRLPDAGLAAATAIFRRERPSKDVRMPPNAHRRVSSSPTVPLVHTSLSFTPGSLALISLVCVLRRYNRVRCGPLSSLSKRDTYTRVPQNRGEGISTKTLFRTTVLWA